jgi:RNA polymerase sigma-54 factor
VHLVVQCLDPSGYLTVSDERLLALAEEAGLAADAGTLGRAIAVVQQLEPRGVGGRDAVEALLLQLDPAEPDYALLCRLLEEFLEDVARNKLPAVARALEVDLSCLDRLVARIRELHLRPGAELTPSSTPPIRPDVLVERTSSGFEVRVAASGLPALSIDEGVRALARDRRQPAAVRRYLRDKIERARWLVDALAQRQRTLLRIARALFEHQRPFLEHGPRRLAPLRMNRLADELDLHVSTVSRAVAGKYAETPWGIRPLRSFFQGSAGGEDTAARSNVREMVRELIEAEDPDHPLSDDELVVKLREQGVSLARRTVAKYRGELDIPSSYRRRRWR